MLLLAAFPGLIIDGSLLVCVSENLFCHSSCLLACLSRECSSLQTHGAPSLVLPDWAPGHHVKAPSRDADADQARHAHDASSTSRADTSRNTDSSTSHPKLNLPKYPIHDVWEEHTEQSTLSESGAESSPDEPSSSSEPSVPGVATPRYTAPGNVGADEPQRKTTPREAASRQDIIWRPAAYSGSAEAAAGEGTLARQGVDAAGWQGKPKQEQKGLDAGAAFMAILIALLAVAVACGLALVGWQQMQRRQV